MRWTEYQGRRCAEIENDELVVTVTLEGGHIARLLHKASGINPLWTPHWPSVEPSEFHSTPRPEYGENAEAELVAGLMGHNVCLDLFGGPSASEASARVPVHGEAPVARYDISGTEDMLFLSTELPLAQIRFKRQLKLCHMGVVFIREVVENLAFFDRPIGWTQHVTLGSPFLEPGSTRLLLNSQRGRVISETFNNGAGALQPDANFVWPLCPRRDGSLEDLSTLTSDSVSGGFTAHLMNIEEETAYFAAWSPSSQLAVGYAWRQDDFPWLARWEENHLRRWAPWNGEGYALGMEFGVSPFVETRRQMVERGTLFGTPTFRWLGARSKLQVDYVAFVRQTKTLPGSVQWNDRASVTLEPAEVEAGTLIRGASV